MPKPNPRNLVSRGLAAVNRRLAKKCPVCANLSFAELGEWGSRRGVDLNHLSPGCRSCAILPQAIRALSPDAQIPDEVYEIAISRREERGPLIIDSIICKTQPAEYEEIRVFTDPSLGPCPWPDLTERRISDNALSPECMHLASTWLRDCTESHPDCGLRDAAVSKHLPKRVIDVGDENTPPRLVAPVPGTIGKYVALSHRWPDVHIITTTTENLARHLITIPLSSMPQTFQEAIFVTQKLGFSYIWIDSLCIVQSGTECDWNEQAGKMQQVYESAVATIAADAGNYPDTVGLTSPKRRQLFRGIPLPGPEKTLFAAAGVWEGDTPAHVPARIQYGVRESSNSVLQTRGWVFQERVLSRRILHFGAHELAWECQSATKCECESFNGITFVGQSSTKTTYNGEWSMRPGGTHLEFIERWMLLVRNYSSRSLTKSYDKLPAMAGLASRASQSFGLTYLAGLWKEQLLQTLLWTAGIIPVIGGGRRHVEYHAPSWAWASIDGATIYANIDPQYEISATLIDAVCKPSRPENPFGAVQEGYLEAEFLVAKATAMLRTDLHFSGADIPGGGLGPNSGTKKIVVVDESLLGENGSSLYPDVKLCNEIDCEEEYLFLRVVHRDFGEGSSPDANLRYAQREAKRLVKGLVVRLSDRRVGAYERVAVYQYVLPPEKDDLGIYRREVLVLV
ncbi:heterokaryon incompatibility protein-domain-containing protein [Podospora didyma]|uniref:Heterokaryon incompatibility protein-domain-containing protein n=1 Tax=Podospora didyma TaxID=330526 RepID=A0AAE0KAE2_9PEZI|nr:heterokaryon incompatibility protein-domain-containing protein [Podospora didyma]